MTTTKLKPCPFCGGEAYLRVEGWIGCDCGAIMTGSAAITIEKWNRRAR